MFENQTYDTILARMLARVSNNFDKREGSVIFDTHSPTAIELQTLYIELDALINEAYGDTASREFLILRCRERGVYPYDATKAVLKGEFTPTTIDVTGRRFNISELNYIAISKISDGVYQMECETPGEVGNNYLGTMIPIDYIEGLETADVTEVLIPGEDEEATEDLRQRYFDSFGEFAYGGNRTDYISKTKAISGVGGVKVDRVWNGDINPADLIPNATVESWYETYIESATGDVHDWLEAVFTAALNKKLTVGGTVKVTIVDADDYGVASSTLINLVQSTLDPAQNAGEGYGVAPIGHVVTVESATGVPVTVKATISFNGGYTWDSLKTAIETAVSDYLLSLREDWGSNDYTVVRISQIEAKILAVEGVVDIANTKVNNSTNNLILTKYQIPTFGSVIND